VIVSIQPWVVTFELTHNYWGFQLLAMATLGAQQRGQEFWAFDHHY